MIKTFWPWFLKPLKGRRSGWRLLFSRWIAFDAIIAVAMTSFLKIDAFDFASKALFPAASILVSMAVAWTARAAAILNEKKFRENVINEERPIEDYVYGYQLSLLILISTVIYVAIMAAGGFKVSYPVGKYLEISSSVFMYFALSLSIRECWSVINFSNLLGILGSRIPKE